MRRRGVTVLIGAVIVLLLGVGIASAPVPYVVLGPGPTVDTLGVEDGKPVIEVKGRETFTSAGQLRLVTVGVQSEPDLLSAVRYWLSDDEAVVPRELYYPPGTTTEQVEEENKQQFVASQSSAETSALRKLGYPVLVTVGKVTEGGPSATALKAGDVITSVGGEAVTSRDRLVELITAKPAGTALAVGYTRGGTPATATITSAAADDGTPRIGIEVSDDQPHPFELSIDLDRIGGPSAGLMLTLGILDKLQAEDLTGGKIIAGTGTIDNDGRVGPIGGIPQKLLGARAANAKFFLTPAENCAEAVSNAQPGLPLVKVATLDEALAALATIRAGGEPPRC